MWTSLSGSLGSRARALGLWFGADLHAHSDMVGGKMAKAQGTQHRHTWEWCSYGGQPTTASHVLTGAQVSSEERGHMEGGSKAALSLQAMTPVYIQQQAVAGMERGCSRQDTQGCSLGISRWEQMGGWTEEWE